MTINVPKKNFSDSSKDDNEEGVVWFTIPEAEAFAQGLEASGMFVVAKLVRTFVDDKGTTPYKGLHIEKRFSDVEKILAKIRENVRVDL